MMNISTIPANLLARRRVAIIVVDGVGALGLDLAKQLTHLGLGALILRDDAPVSAGDIGFRSVDQGRPRAEAAAELLGATAQQTAVMEAPGDASVAGADLHIVTGSVVSADLLRRAAAESPAVLPVAASERGWRVGPLLFGDAPLCVDCWQASEISVSEQNPGDAPAPAVVHSAAAVTTHQVQVLIDGAQCCLMEQAALMADAATGRIAPVAVSPQADCGCMTLVGAVTEPGSWNTVGL